MAISITPAEEAAGAGAALGLVGSLFFFKKPNTTEVAVGTLVGAVVGYLGAQAWGAAQASVISASSTTTTTSTTPTTAPTTTTSPSDNPNDAGGGGSNF